ncbi:MAG: LPS export ABC transporter periplasmic protein LptC [Symploca sp. SIO3C6]|nr:LPS export ABC transporter periplasmic protein LptC [Symploca sp. SIO3C6]
MSRKSNQALPLREQARISAKAKQFLAFAFGLLVMATILSACEGKSNTSEALKNNSAETEVEASLVLKNVTLDQVDNQGLPLWKVKAKQATYSQDQKTALVNNPTGDLFQDGEVVLQVSAKSGEVKQDGETVFLKDEVIATDLRNGAVFKGDELEWRPQEDLLVVRNNLQGNHPQLQASAKEGRYFSRQQRLELFGQVAALSKEPNFQMKTEHLVWLIQAQKLIGPVRTQMERYKNNTLSDRVEADKSEFNQKTNTVTLKQNVQLTSLEPPMLMSSNSVVWNLDAQTAASDQPVQIIDQQEKLTVTANQGQIDLEREVANFTGGVQGIADRNQAKLYANQLRWDIPTQNMQASGNVIYQQIDPPLLTTGAAAVGKLQDQSIVVNSGAGKPVITEIIP